MSNDSKKPNGQPEKEIVLADGPYEFVARLKDGKHIGYLWSTEKGKPRTVLVSVTASSNTEAIAMVKKQFYDNCRDAAEDSPADTKIASAWKVIWPHLNKAQVKQVLALYRAEGHRKGTRELAAIAGYKDHRGVNRWLGGVGFQMFCEAPRKLLASECSKAGVPVYTFTLCTGPDQKASPDDVGFVWEMRPEIARGLELAHLV